MAVIAGSILIYFFHIYWVDPVITVLIGIYILKETYSVLREAVDILMQATPKSLKLPAVKNSLENLEGIDNIHHVHIWNLNDSQVHFECHIDVSNDMKISETDVLLQKIKETLKNNFDIAHVTIQFEYNCCAGKELIKR